MIYGRKFYYILGLSWYYTFIVLFAWGVNFIEVLLPTIVITIFSYFWVLRSVSKKDPHFVMEWKDLAFNISIYAFITFFIGFVSGLTYEVTSFIGYFLIISPVPVWGIIWIDMYSQQMKEMGLDTYK